LLDRQAQVADAEDDEADDSEAEGEYLHAPHGVDRVQWDVENLGHVAREQRDGDRDVEQDIGQRCHMRDSKGAQQQVDGHGDKEIGELVCMVMPGKHGNHLVSVSWAAPQGAAISRCLATCFMVLHFAVGAQNPVDAARDLP